eukprot:gene20659-55457_t
MTWINDGADAARRKLQAHEEAAVFTDSRWALFAGLADLRRRIDKGEEPRMVVDEVGITAAASPHMPAACGPAATIAAIVAEQRLREDGMERVRAAERDTQLRRIDDKVREKKSGARGSSHARTGDDEKAAMVLTDADHGRLLHHVGLGSYHDRLLGAGYRTVGDLHERGSAGAFAGLGMSERECWRLAVACSGDLSGAALSDEEGRDTEGRPRLSEAMAQILRDTDSAETDGTDYAALLRDGAGSDGAGFDYTFLNDPGASPTVLSARKGMVVDNRQSNHAWGPWMW